MNRRLLVGFLLILLVALCGCAHVEEYADIAKKQGVSEGYLKSLAAWTRTSVEYSEFETRGKIICTYKSPEFKDAYVKEYSRLYLLPKGDEEKKRQLTKEMSADETEFAFYAYTPDMEANDFAKADSTWKIFLVDEKGNQVYPNEIRRIRKITPVLEQFFPYINQYHGRYYTLSFPRQPEGSSKRIVFTSVLATITLEWK